MKAFRDNFAFAGVALLMGLAGYAHYVSQQEKHPDAWQEQQLALVDAVKQLQAREYQEHVVNLPEDASAWHTTLVYATKDASDAPSRTLANAFSTTPRLQTLLKQTTPHYMHPTDLMYRDRIAKYYGSTTPAVIVQMPDGKVVYKKSGDAIPYDGNQLANEIAAAIAACPNCRPRPQPQPSPTPAPTPDTPPAVIPDIGPTPDQQPANDDSVPVWLYLIPVGAGLFGGFRELRKEQ